MSLILVWQREELLQDYEQQQEEEEEQTDFERVIVNQVNNEQEQAGSLGGNWKYVWFEKLG